MIIHNNRISLALNDTDHVKKVGVPVQYAKDGNISNDIWDTTMDCAVRGETGNSTVYTEAEAKQLHNDTTGLAEELGMSPADFISQCMTGEDAQALSEDETPLEDYTSSQLERALSRVKEQRSEKRQTVSEQVEQEREEEQRREAAAIRNMADQGIPDAILNQLQEGNLPVTAENAERLIHAADMAAERRHLSPASMKFFIINQLSVTPENINGSVYGAGGARNGAHQDGGTGLGAAAAGRQVPNTGRVPSSTGHPADTGFETVESQVTAILDAGGVDVNEDSMRTAKWLYDNDFPVTAENVKLYQQLEGFRELDDETVLDRIVDNIVDGLSAENADLTKLSREEAGLYIRRLLDADDGDLRRTYTTEADFISAKRQMEEIRLSMTVDAARAMSAKGIELDISNLAKIVDELRAQEQQMKESLLAETGLPMTEANGERMADTVRAAKNVLSAPTDLLGATIGAGDTQTLGELSDEATNQKEKYARMAQTYEAVGTEVRRDLGDSLKKAFGNIDDILEELGMETTGMNQRAVRILAYNQMALTAENVDRMKAYDAKVTTLMENLKPQVVAELIKQDLNPLEMSLDELGSAVNEIRGRVADEDTPFRRFLWKMDRQGGLTDEERQSMIGVYRLLDKIQKSDGAIIGQVVKEGRELSLSSLLSANRTRKAEGMDIRVDDGFGGLEEVITAGTSIDEQIHAAYGAATAGRLQRVLSPKVLKDSGEHGMELSLETLLEKCLTEGETEQEMKPYYQEMADSITAAMEDPEGKIQEFLEALAMPDTAANRYIAQEYLGSGSYEYRHMWKRSESESVQEAFDDPEELESVYGQIDEAHQNDLAKQRERDDITYGSLLSLARMAGGISFYQTLRHHRTYEVPIVTEQGVTTCHVTIQNGGDRKGTVEISMESDELGSVQATFRVNGSLVRGFVTAERSDRMEACQRILSGFEKDLEENGFTMDSESLIRGSRHSLHKVQDTNAHDRQNGADNKDLYQVAKCFLVNVKRAGTEEE